MTDRELERRLERALSHAAPDDPEEVLSRCETRKGNVIPMKQSKTPAVRWLAAACLALLLVGGGSGMAYQQAHAVASVVSLDVNPSIELKVNKNEKVLSCVGLNEEAREVLADMGGGADLKGTKLDVAVNAIVGSLVRCGYLDNISSAILISVEDKDQDRAAKLQQELTAAVDSVLREQSANAAVLSQTVAQDEALKEQARENNISTGKAYLVRQVMEMNGTIANSTEAFEQISALSVEELKDLLETGEKRIPIGKAAAQAAAEKYAGVLPADSVTAQVDPELDEARPHYEVKLRHPTLGKFEYKVDAFTGEVLSGQKNILDTAQPSQKAEIGEKRAKEIALSHAGLTERETTALFVTWDRDDGSLRYEVEFCAGGYEYDYEIDGYTGAVLDWDKEKDEKGVIGGADGSTAVITAEYISPEKAKAAALSHAGLKESQVTFEKVKLEKEDGRGIYEIKFHSGSTKYEYEIDALDGSLWDYEWEEKTADVSGSITDIGRDKAKAAALADAGLRESQTTDWKVKLEDEDGRPVYEVEFKAGDMEYEYKIDGTTGAVLERDAEEHDDDECEEKDSDKTADTGIGQDKAKAAALGHAGVKESQASGWKVELEDEDGRPVYEVEFKAGDMEYEYKIDGISGVVLDHECDGDHHHDEDD